MTTDAPNAAQTRAVLTRRREAPFFGKSYAAHAILRALPDEAERGGSAMLAAMRA